MNKTQRQFIRLGDYIVKKFAPEPSSVFSISDEFKFVREADYYLFRYYKIYVTVTNDRLDLKLPAHIDIADFNKSKLLKDMWKDILEYTRDKEKMISDALAPFIEGLQILNRALVAFNKELNSSIDHNETKEQHN